MKTLKTAAWAFSALILLAFVVFVVNQTSQLVILAGNVSPALGQLVLWGLIGLYAAVVAVPVILLIRLPRALVPPATDVGPEFDEYLHRLQRRLSQNFALAGRPVESRADVEAALAELNRQSDGIVKETASIVFLTTAVSQSGRLDGLVVLGAQSRMVWRIAQLYYQRPTVRELINLYANVAATVFVTTQLEELDVEEQIEPVIQSSVGAVIGAVPGMTAVATILTSSILTGSTNAFLTLRVGVIARRYCGSLVRPQRRMLRKAAAAEAAGMLVPLVWSGSRRITSSTMKAIRNKLPWKRGVKDVDEGVVFVPEEDLPIDPAEADIRTPAETRRRWWKPRTPEQSAVDPEHDPGGGQTL